MLWHLGLRWHCLCLRQRLDLRRKLGYRRWHRLGLSHLWLRLRWIDRRFSDSSALREVVRDSPEDFIIVELAYPKEDRSLALSRLERPKGFLNGSSKRLREFEEDVVSTEGLTCPST